MRDPALAAGCGIQSDWLANKALRPKQVDRRKERLTKACGSTHETGCRETLEATRRTWPAEDDEMPTKEAMLRRGAM